MSTAGTAHTLARIAAVASVVAVLAWTIWAGTRAGPDARTGPRNVILIVSDSLRAPQLQLYGYEKPTSPVLAELESSSLVYEKAYSHHSFTWPSISNLFTGLPYSRLVESGLFDTPGAHTNFQWDGGLSEATPTLAKRLAAGGVRSYGVSASPYISRRTGFELGFARFFDWDEWLRVGLDSNVPYVPGERVNDVARAYLRELRWPKRQPWFLYLHYMDTHMAYHAREDDLARFGDPAYDRADRVDGGAALDPSGKWLKWRTPDLQDWLEPGDIEQLVAHYDAQILRFDRALGALLHDLERMGLRDDTIVIVTSDHGESLFERGFWGHGYLSRNEEQHVPLIIILPPGSEAGARIAFPVTTTDIFHTLITHFGLEPVSDPHLLPQVADLFRAEPMRNVAYSEGPGGTRVYRDGRFALYQHRDMANWKRPLPTEDGDFLYDLSIDPGERTELLEDDATGAKRARERLVAAGPSALPGQNAPDPMLSATGKLRKSLAALGYIDE